MKKLFLFSVVAFALSTVSCEKGQLRDLENPKFEEFNDGEFKAEGDPDDERTSGIDPRDIRIPSHG